jgi:hypothetical protein
LNVPQRHDAHGAAGGVRGLRHGVEGAVAADGDHRCIGCCRLGGHLWQITGPANQQFALAPMCRQSRFDHASPGIDILRPGGSVYHEQ